MKRIAAAGLVWLAGCAHQAARVPAPGPAPNNSAMVPTILWKQHDPERPQPRIARAAGAVTTRAPADAVVLFDGTSLDHWRDEKGGGARWVLQDGYMEVAPGTGSIHTSSEWGDAQLHIEWATPLPPEGEGQARGNSGVLFMNTYEVQVLDSYGNQTYPDGQAGAIFGQYPPLVNASLPPGEWQSYDIIFHRPHFEGGRVTQPARFTVFQNGVLVQDNVSLVGPTTSGKRDPYAPHANRLPLALQDAGFKVRYRNIWIRELEEGE